MVYYYCIIQQSVVDKAQARVACIDIIATLRHGFGLKSLERTASGLTVVQDTWAGFENSMLGQRIRDFCSSILNVCDYMYDYCFGCIDI